MAAPNYHDKKQKKPPATPKAGPKGAPSHPHMGDGPTPQSASGPSTSGGGHEPDPRPPGAKSVPKGGAKIPPPKGQPSLPSKK